LPDLCTVKTSSDGQVFINVRTTFRTKDVTSLELLIELIIFSHLSRRIYVNMHKIVIKDNKLILN
jgi:hypothetical protein